MIQANLTNSNVSTQCSSGFKKESFEKLVSNVYNSNNKSNQDREYRACWL